MLFRLLKRCTRRLYLGIEVCLAHISVWIYCLTFLCMKVVETYVPELLRNGFSFLKSSKELRSIAPPHSLYADPSYGKHRYVKAGGTKYHYVESGSSNNKLLLCLHDFGDFWYGYRNQMGVLKSNLWVVAPDLKGFGDSDKPLQANQYRMEVIVMELLQLILSLKKERVIILAHGLGSYIGWHFVSAFPDMVEKYISIDGPHPKALCSSINRSWSSLNRFKWLYMYRFPFLPEIELMLDNKAISPKARSQLDKEVYKYTFSRQTDWTGGLNYYRNFPLYLCHLRSKVEDQILPLPIQVLFITGDCQSKVDFEQICRSSKFVDKFAVQVVENADRNPHQTHPDQVNDLIKEFLDIRKVESEIHFGSEFEIPFDAPKSQINSIVSRLLGLAQEKSTSMEISPYSSMMPCKY
uniref:Abhydrolase domain-containing protein 7 n=1 Tax=Caligus clemensi TaxID=344056 RepID=C1C2B5_CALCM|nr:Abhydrolase domain-containing protein 7 [Caligus clemensi]